MKKLFGLVSILVIIAILCVAAFNAAPTVNDNPTDSVVTPPVEEPTDTPVITLPETDDESTSEVIVIPNDSAPSVIPAPTQNTVSDGNSEVITIPSDEDSEEPEGTTTAATMELHQIKANSAEVGCANAYLVKAGDFTMVIDGGHPTTRSKVMNYLRNSGVTTIDVYVATHWHGDHVGNMSVILNEFGTPETIVYGPSKNLSSSVSIPNGKGEYRQMKDGDIFNFNGMQLKCMGPYTITSNGKNNEDSLNFLITFGEVKMFMTGDYVHKEVLNCYREELTDVDVYQMAHHGLKVSNFSGSSDVLPTLNPDIILVPANSNKPANELFARLGITADVYNNSNGNIIITTNGTKIDVSTQKQNHFP